MNILQEADEIIHGERATAYGSPSVSTNRIAKMWSAILDKEVTPQQVLLCMIALKISREVNSHKRDNVVDIAGYAAILEMIEKDAGAKYNHVSYGVTLKVDRAELTNEEKPQAEATPTKDYVMYFTAGEDIRMGDCVTDCGGRLYKVNKEKQ